MLVLSIQVQYNLFEAYAAKTDDSFESKETNNKRYFVCRDIEEAYIKQAGGGSKTDSSDSLKPRFYNLASAEYSTQVCVCYVVLLLAAQSAQVCVCCVVLLLAEYFTQVCDY